MRVASASPVSGRPKIAATERAMAAGASRPGCSRTNTTVIPASRNCRTTSRGPMVPSVMSRSGRISRTDSGEMAWPLPVTTGRSSTPGNVVEISRPTRRSPNPNAQTVAAREPDMSRARTRSAASMVTSSSPVSSSEVTVAGSEGVVLSSMGSIETSPRIALEDPTQSRGASSQVMSASGGRFSAATGAPGGEV